MYHYNIYTLKRIHEAVIGEWCHCRSNKLVGRPAGLQCVVGALLSHMWLWQTDDGEECKAYCSYHVHAECC